MYLAMMFYCNDLEQSEMISREVDTDELEAVFCYLQEEADVNSSIIEKIIIIKNNESCPTIHQHWTKTDWINNDMLMA